MSRCISCNTMFNRNPGWRTLPDGTKVEEDMCPDCRDKALYPEDARDFTLANITELDFVWSPAGVTPVKVNSDYE